MHILISKTGVPIRLPEERWFHITEEHSEMAGYYFDVLETVEEPEAIYEGKMGEFLAVRGIEEGKYIVVVYKELSKEDGFVITAPYPRIWTAYDKEADVLYINFKKPSHADDSELTDDDIIIRYEKGEVIGFTILNASRKKLSKVKAG